MLAAAVVVGIPLLLGVAAGLYLNSKLTRTENIHPQGARNPGTDIVVAGSDSREGDNAAAVGNKPGEVTGERTDTIILLHVRDDYDAALGISIPRDTWITMPACAAKAANSAGKGMINATLEAGGPSCLARAVEELSGVGVEHYMQVDFTGVESMTNAVGGVKVCVSGPVKDDKSGLDIPAGTTKLTGQQALQWTRSRYGFNDGLGDIGRVVRQQYFLQQMLHRAKSANPWQLYRFAVAAADSLTVDRGWSVFSMGRVGLGIVRGQLDFTTMPFTTEGVPPGRVGEDKVKAAPLWRAVKEDDIPLSSGGTAVGPRTGRGPHVAAAAFGATSLAVRPTPAALVAPAAAVTTCPVS